MGTFLDSLEQQNRERTEETSDHQEHAQRPPGGGVPDQIVLRFFRNVGVPVQHVLAETDVGPKNGEGEHPFSHDVIMLQRHHSEVAGLTQRRSHKNEQRHRTAGRAGKNVRAPHGGVPAIVQAHHPVEGGKAQRQTKNRQPGKGYLTHPNRAARIAIAILGHGKAAQEKCDPSEENEIKKGTEKEERPVQILSFAVERCVLARRDIHPLKKMMAEHQNRDHKNKECTEEERDILKLPAHYYGPFRIGGVMHNRPKQTAAAKGEKIKEAEQPGEAELHWRGDGANQTEQEPNHSAAREQQG